MNREEGRDIDRGNERENNGDVRDPSNSRSIITPGRMRGGRVRSKNGKPIAFENNEVVKPKRKIIVAPNGIVESVENVEGRE